MDSPICFASDSTAGRIPCPAQSIGCQVAIHENEASSTIMTLMDVDVSVGIPIRNRAVHAELSETGRAPQPSESLDRSTPSWCLEVPCTFAEESHDLGSVPLLKPRAIAVPNECESVLVLDLQKARRAAMESRAGLNFADPARRPWRGASLRSPPSHSRGSERDREARDPLSGAAGGAAAFPSPAAIAPGKVLPGTPRLLHPPPS